MQYLKKIKEFALCVVFIYNCTQKQSSQNYIAPLDSRELIAGDSLKTWKLAKRYNGNTRMNMGDCFLSYRQTFYASGKVYDNNNEQENCGPSLDGNWTLYRDTTGVAYIRIHSEALPGLLGVDEMHKDFRVFYVSNDSLHLSFIHNQYGTKRRISDYLVRQDLSVIDREFHH